MSLDLALLERPEPLVLIEITQASGSTPRDAGAQMLVSASSITGTIGGGQLEYQAIAKAREMLAEDRVEQELDIPLGPQISQCCGGRVKLRLTVPDRAVRAKLTASYNAEIAAHPTALIFGGGHVGAALARALAPLPVAQKVIESREGFGPSPTAMPESVVRHAPPGAAFIITTHLHDLDFLITAEALARGDAAYVGLIGSATKRTSFERWLSREMPGVSPDALICPIGAPGKGDKRADVIAAYVAVELLNAFGKKPQ